jgi:hypothetical protein
MPTLYKYYITDLFEGAIVGTDSDEEAENLATSEEHFVVDTSTGEWLLADGTRQSIEALQ